MGGCPRRTPVAFVQNLFLKELAGAYPEARRTAHELWYATPSGGTVFVYPFGAMVLYDVPEAERESHGARLRAARPGLTDANAVEELTVREEAVAHPDVRDGVWWWRVSASKGRASPR